MTSHAEEVLKRVVEEYEAAKTEALARRDARLREFAAAGWRPIDIQRVTGYSRETIRQALHPEVREAANVTRRKKPAPTRPPADYVTYADRKPYIVVDSLDNLHGPVRGTVKLPTRLDWSPNPVYDLSNPAELESMYRTVLNEAGTVDDLSTWVNRSKLFDLWQNLWLPIRLRRAWEQAFPELVSGGSVG